MPELPEVETSRRGIEPHLAGATVTGVTIRDARLRWPVPRDLGKRLAGARIRGVGRRAKYLLIDTDKGTAILHLGMSGSVYVVDLAAPAALHEHVDIELDNGKALRFRDPRRFGSLLFSRVPLEHPLLARLGPEPLGEEFSGRHLFERSRGRRAPVKQFIMQSENVVGVGNIYASESLFFAGIHPKRAAGRVSLARYESLAASIRSVLEKAIRAGGTTLRDFYGGDGQAGYFRQQLAVYGRDGLPCRQCEAAIASVILGNRNTFYCRHCQT